MSPDPQPGGGAVGGGLGPTHLTATFLAALPLGGGPDAALRSLLWLGSDRCLGQPPKPDLPFSHQQLLEPGQGHPGRPKAQEARSTLSC